MLEGKSDLVCAWLWMVMGELCARAVMCVCAVMGGYGQSRVRGQEQSSVCMWSCACVFG